MQGEVEAVLSRLADRPVTVIAAGRTDAGVHATGQIVGVEMPPKWTPPALERSLNALLPPDVWAAAADAAPPDFHARYDAIARGYIYRIGLDRQAMSPFRRGWCWPVPDPLDRPVLDSGAGAIVGEHSFRGYARSGQPERGYRCTVHHARWLDAGAGRLEFRVVANRFLHHMVRYLVGTMVDAARGRRSAADIAGLLDEERGLETSPPAPPEGLFLARVYYPGDVIDPAGPASADLP